MSTHSRQSSSAAERRAQRGFTLVELMVTIGIAMFLLGGLVTIVENIRQTYFNQQALAQLEDQQRFAMTVLTDVIQAAGYFPDPTAWSPGTSLPLISATTYGIGQAIYGTHTSTTAPDTIGVRFRTAFDDNIINCTGQSNTAFNPSHAYTNTFSVVIPAGKTSGPLQCALDTGTTVTLVTGVNNLQIYYGVKRSNATTGDYSADTYLTASNMSRGNTSTYGNGDWDNITSVRIILTMANPLFGQPGQPQTSPFERVVTVMGRGGVDTQ
jgi:type IV pilus assembly protein PilW